MRILFASTRSAGHFNPLVPFAHACVRAGHEVLVSAPGPCAEHAARAGLPFAEHGDTPREVSDPIIARARGLDPDQANQVALSELFGEHARHALPGMLHTAREWRPDAIVRE